MEVTAGFQCQINLLIHMPSQSNEYSEWSSLKRNQLESSWVRALPNRVPGTYPKLVRAQLVWGFKVRSGCLPLNPGTGRAARYGCSRRRGGGSTQSRGGQIRLSKSVQFVASRRLKKGDPVGVTWTLSNPNECMEWLLHVMKHSARYTQSGASVGKTKENIKRSADYVSQVMSISSRAIPSTTRVHLGIPLGSPRNYPVLRDYYEAYRPLGSQSQRTRNLVRSGGHEKVSRDTKKRVNTLFCMIGETIN